jgi:hypothetical protein
MDFKAGRVLALWMASRQAEKSFVFVNHNPKDIYQSVGLKALSQVRAFQDAKNLFHLVLIH